MPLALFFTGILNAGQAMAGFGDPTVVFIAALFVVGVGLEAAGVTTWAGQLIVEKAGQSRTRLMLLIMAAAAVFCATISVNGTVAALLPVVVVVAIRLGIPTSQLLLPMCFSTHGAVMLTLIGAPLNILSSNAAKDAGMHRSASSSSLSRAFQCSSAPGRSSCCSDGGCCRNATVIPCPPTSARTPRRSSNTIVSRTKRSGCACDPRRPMSGRPRSEVDLRDYSGLSLVGFQEGDGARPLARPTLAEGDVLLVRGDAQAVGRLALDKHLAVQSEQGGNGVADTLFNRDSGLAEVVIRRVPS